MEIEYTLGEQDLLALFHDQMDHYPDGSSRMPARLFLWSLLVLMVAFVLYFGQSFAILLPICLVIAAAVALLHFFRHAVFGAAIARQIRQRRETLLGWRRLRIEPNELTVSTRTESLSIDRKAVKAMRATVEYAFVFTSISPVDALVIPRRAFPSDQAFQDFVGH